LEYFSRFGMLYQEKSGNPEQVSILQNPVWTKYLLMYVKEVLTIQSR
jgi:hypothetical protein